MKKAAVPTTTASGAAVRSSSRTAVQSVYIAAVAEPAPSSQSAVQGLPRPRRLLAGLMAVAGLMAASMLMVVAGSPAGAGVVFDNCQPTSDGGLSCDTRPTGNTLLDDQAARYSLFNAASPGWNEFDPYQDLEEEMGDSGF